MIRKSTSARYLVERDESGVGIWTQVDDFPCLVSALACVALSERLDKIHKYQVIERKIIDRVVWPKKQRKKKKHSFTDVHGRHWVACSECNRGGNGSDKEKCSCGCKVKRWNKQGCYLGTESEAKG